MSHFSDESHLIVRNWDAYQDIIKAGEHLKLELTRVRSSIGERLRKEKWWSSNLVCSDPFHDELSFSDCRWGKGDGHLIWIGVSNMTTDSFFGDAPPPSFYVWIAEKLPELKVEMQQIVSSSGKQPVGGFSPKPGMVVEKSLSKCLPEQIDKLEDMLFASVAEFYEFHVQFFNEFDKAAQKYLKTRK